MSGGKACCCPEAAKPVDQRRFKPATERVIEQANGIIQEYLEAGFSLTLRQLYYQFVARGLIPNKQTEYKRLGSIVNDGRLAGLIDWDAIEDRTRNLREYRTHESPSAAVHKVAKDYIKNLWDDQGVYVEIWIEKDALVGVIEPVCGRWRLPHFACRGYSSQSEQYVAGLRLADQLQYGKRVVIIHLGDHDPSGIDMSRDNRDRLQLFARDDFQEIELRRIALNMEQIRLYRPPPNPAKESDSRIAGYLRDYGTRSSWELDALDPKVIDALIDQEVRIEVDEERWDSSLARETRNREKLLGAARQMEDDEL